MANKGDVCKKGSSKSHTTGGKTTYSMKVIAKMIANKQTDAQRKIIIKCKRIVPR